MYHVDGFSARLQYLQCVNNVDTVVLHQAIHVYHSIQTSGTELKLNTELTIDILLASHGVLDCLYLIPWTNVAVI